VTHSLCLVALGFVSLHVLGVPPLPTAQLPSESGTARIAGVVVTVNGTAEPSPARRAIVTLSGDALAIGRSVITHDDGRFVLDGLPAGRFTLAATKPAYLRAVSGATRPGRAGVPLALEAGQRVTGLTLTLVRGAAISGVIRDPGGEAIFGVTVSAMRVLPDGTLTTAATIPSDDRGAYRLFGLPAGDYYVSAAHSRISGNEVIEPSVDQIDRRLAALRARRARPTLSARAPAPASAPEPLPTSSFAPVFHPQAFSPADAQRIALGAGDDRIGVDIVFYRVRSVTVSGVLAGAPASGPVQITMRASGPSLQTAGVTPVLRGRPDGDGPFEFGGVIPGRYVITARTAPGTRPILFSRAEVEVAGGSVNGVALVMQPAFHLKGRIVFDTTRLKPPADLSAIQVMAESIPGASVGGAGGGGRGTSTTIVPTTDAQGNFDVDGIIPGQYRIGTSLGTDPAGWWLRSVMINGRDVLDAPLLVEASTPLSGAVITFSDRHTELSGQLQAPAGRGASDYFIVVFPDDRTMWRPGARRIRATRAGTDATYVFRDLPPGTYRLAAATDVSSDDLIDPAFFESLLPSTVVITLGDGERRTQSLRIGGSDVLEHAAPTPAR